MRVQTSIFYPDHRVGMLAGSVRKHAVGAWILAEWSK